jgi:hypothetical protein
MRLFGSFMRWLNFENADFESARHNLMSDGLVHCGEMNLTLATLISVWTDLEA